MKQPAKSNPVSRPRAAMTKEGPLFRFFPFLSFFLPLFFYCLTLLPCAGLADSAEFAYVSKVWGIPHPPGFPAYVFLSWLWSGLCSFFLSRAVALAFFSALCSATSILILYKTLVLFLVKYSQETSGDERKAKYAALFTSLAFAFGMTVWQWSNAVEVYAFHLLAMSLVLYGLVRFNISGNRRVLFIAAAGIGLGIANHHMTMVFALPFLLFFFFEDVIVKKNGTGDSFLIQCRKKWLLNRNFWLLAGSAFLVALVFYVLMMFRAQQDYEFEFGNPDTFKRLLYHLSGGLWLQHSVEHSASVIRRIPYFFMLFYRQYFICLFFLFSGFFWLIYKKYFRLFFITFGYLLLLLLYQLRIVQVADTDAYMIYPFFVSTLSVAVGIHAFIKNNTRVMLAALAALASIPFNFSVSDRSDYDVGDALMAEFSASAPVNSIVLVSEWTMRIQYTYCRAEKKFRNDLIVLRADLKGGNYRSLRAGYPDFYEKIKKEYNAYIQSLAEVNDYYIYSDYFTLDSGKQDSTYRAMIRKVFQIAEQEGRAVLMDRTTIKFFTDINLIAKQDIKPNGLFFSTKELHTGHVLKTSGKWMYTALLPYDPAATNTILDYYELINQCTGFYRAMGDTARYRQSSLEIPLIDEVRTRHRRNIPFAW